ncbi:MAG: hypothetical protein AAF602_28365 [Myxococcota bacterium]
MGSIGIRMPPLRIVDLEELDLDDDARVTHHGVLFTGVERSHHADGSLEWEACYDDGSRHGPCRRWLNRATSNALVYERYFELDAHTMQFAVRPFVDPGPTL